MKDRKLRKDFECEKKWVRDDIKYLFKELRIREKEIRLLTKYLKVDFVFHPEELKLESKEAK